MADINLIITTNANEVTKDVDRLGTSAVNLGTKLNSTNMKGQASGMTAYQKSVKKSSDFGISSSCPSCTQESER